jgi:membrane protease YdiL (CAAX protease family)
MVPTFALLTLAVAALWLGAGERARGWKRQAWLLPLAACLAAALAGGFLQPPGLGWIALLGLAAWAHAEKAKAPAARVATAAAALLLAAGLMLHVLPGFLNPRVLAGIRFSPDAIPYTLFLNLDKTVAGILLLGWIHARIRKGAEWRAMARAAAPGAAVTLLLVMALSLATGYVRPEPKFPRETWLWLWVNLCFTCLAEEALFRGFIQHRLQQWWGGWTGGRWSALAVAAALFGLAHFAGGPGYVALGTVAGLGYGWVYQRTGRIEASILTHFALNTVHFFWFTYPARALPPPP